MVQVTNDQMGAMFQGGARNNWYGSLYDTYQLTQAVQASATIVLFTDPKSGTKGIQLTNMTDSKKLNAGEAITVDRIRVQFLKTCLADIENFLMAYTMEIKYGGKLVFQQPLDCMPGGGGVSFQSNAATTASATTINQQVANNGPLHPDAGFKLMAPNLLYFTSGPAIEVNLLTGATPPTATATASGGTNVFMRVYLDGLRETLN